MVPFSATSEPLTFRLLSSVFAEGSATNNSTVYTALVFPSAAVTRIVSVLDPGLSGLAPVTVAWAAASSVTTFTVATVVPLARFTVELGAASTPFT